MHYRVRAGARSPFMISSCLIGSTGFVGSNLQIQTTFQDGYASANSSDMRGKRYDVAVCCGVSAMKWRANAEPEEDLQRIRGLLANLAELQAEQFILISTVDVFSSPDLVDEDSDPHSSLNEPYGKHRLLVEDFVCSRFDHSLIVRLPGLFGRGLKKNVIYDLLHDNNLNVINPDAAFQYYDINGLWRDIQTARNAGLEIAHFATEPIVTSTIAERIFPGKKLGEAKATSRRYDMRTRFAEVFGGHNGYLYDAPQVLQQLDSYIASERGHSAAA